METEQMSPFVEEGSLFDHLDQLKGATDSFIDSARSFSAYRSPQELNNLSGCTAEMISTYGCIVRSAFEHGFTITEISGFLRTLHIDEDSRRASALNRILGDEIIQPVYLHTAPPLTFIDWRTNESIPITSEKDMVAWRDSEIEHFGNNLKADLSEFLKHLGINNGTSRSFQPRDLLNKITADHPKKLAVFTAGALLSFMARRLRK